MSFLADSRYASTLYCPNESAAKNWDEINKSVHLKINKRRLNWIELWSKVKGIQN